MATVNPFDGSVYLTPDHAAGYGQAISQPSTKLSTMVSSGYYFQQESGDVDVFFINCEHFLVSLYQSLSNQRLSQMFVFRSTSIGGQNKIRLIHRNLGITFSLESALRAVGVDITLSDDYSATMTTINQVLAGQYISIYKAA